MIIFKERLPSDTLLPVSVRLPYTTVEEAKKHIFHLDIQYDVPNMWYQADGGNQNDQKDYLIIAISTGYEWDEFLSTENYIGTLLLYEGTLVLHYFLLPDNQI